MKKTLNEQKKTSDWTGFSPFCQEINSVRGKYNRIIYINCRHIQAIANAINSHGELIAGKCDIFLGGDYSESAFQVNGDADKLLKIVRSHCEMSEP